MRVAPLLVALWCLPCAAHATDRDGDHIADDVDLCPDERESYNGCDDDDGCPDRAIDGVWSGLDLGGEQIQFSRGSARLPRGAARRLATLTRELDLLPGGLQVSAYSARGEPSALAQARANQVVEVLVAAGAPKQALRSLARRAPPDEPHPSSARLSAVDDRFVGAPYGCVRSDEHQAAETLAMVKHRPVEVGTVVSFDELSGGRARLALVFSPPPNERERGRVYFLDRHHPSYLTWERRAKEVWARGAALAVEWRLRQTEGIDLRFVVKHRVRGPSQATEVADLHPVTDERVRAVRVRGSSLEVLGGDDPTPLSLSLERPRATQMRRLLEASATDQTKVRIVHDTATREILDVRSAP